MIDTRDKILTKALELFNENGIEYTGMRELAAILNMRVGNITYYFATKDHLVFSLSEQYSALNSQIHTDNPVTSLYEFLKKASLLYENGIEYRCLMLSMVHIMQQNPMIAERYKEVQNMRSQGLQRNIQTLVTSKHLILKSVDEQWFLVSANSLINRFWMSEAAISGKRGDLTGQVNHYLKLLAFLFRPYASKKGVGDLEQFLGEMG